MSRMLRVKWWGERGGNGCANVVEWNSGFGNTRVLLGVRSCIVATVIVP